MDECEQHLSALRDELAGRGVRCELETQGLVPRLRIYCHGEGITAEFDNNVVAAPIAGRWFFFWPWAEPIGPVLRLVHAAGRILDDMGLGDGPDDDGPGRSFTSVAVRRKLRQARLSIFSPARPPGPAARNRCPHAAPHGKQ